MGFFDNRFPSMSEEQSYGFNNSMSETLEAMDLSLPFHNASHVINVFNAVIEMVNQMEFLSSNEKIVLACIGMMHDVAHPGISNTQHALWNTPLLQNYGHQSPNEKMHADVACMILRKNKILQLFPCYITEDNIQDMILATDMVQHFNVLNGANSIKTGSRQNLYNIIMKCADIFHITKSFEECSYWAQKHNEEAGLLLNWDHEKKFLDKMGQPLFERLHEMCPCSAFEEYIERIRNNSMRYGWESRVPRA